MVKWNEVLIYGRAISMEAGEPWLAGNPQSTGMLQWWKALARAGAQISGPPITQALLFEVSVIGHQLQSKNITFPQPLTLSVPDIQPFHGWKDQKQMILLLKCPQKVNSSLTLHCNACVIHLISSHYVSILLSHLTKGRKVSIVQ